MLPVQGHKMRIALLHTAEVHVATFDAIFADLDVDVELIHHVAPELLERAKTDGIDSVRADVLAVLDGLMGADAVVCTCSTLGPLADEVAQSAPHVFRVDRPLMEQACQDGANIVVALCLDSTRQATLDLLDACAQERQRAISPRVLICRDAWAFFESGDSAGYAESIANAISDHLASTPDIDCVILAQASMRVAETYLTDLKIPVHSAPELAARHSIVVAQTTLARHS